VIAVFGVKGSPGATTTALLSAALWPAEAAVVEADPAGADLPLRLAGPMGQALPASPSIAQLAVDAAAGSAVATGFWVHATQTAAGVPVVLGLPSPEPMEETIRQHGGYLASGLRAQEHVIIDAGRLTPSSSALVFAAAADVVALVIPDSTEGFFHARDLLGGLVNRSAREAGIRSMVLPIIIAEARRSGAALAQLREVVGKRGIAAADPMCIGWDPKSVSRLLASGVHGLEKTVLVRSARPVVERLFTAQQQIREARDQQLAAAAQQQHVPGPQHHAAPPQQIPPPPPRQMAWPPPSGERGNHHGG
jgi:hypothetical protein